MSWDVAIMKLPIEVIEIEDITEDNMASMGSSKEVVSILQQLFPDTDFSDTSWGTLVRKTYSIEFNIAREENINFMMLHIKGNKDAIKVLRRIHEETGWRALDVETGLIDFDNEPERGIQEWQRYRDHVIKKI